MGALHVSYSCPLIHIPPLMRDDVVSDMVTGVCIAMLCPTLRADPTLTINNLCHVTSSVKDWYRLGHYNYGLGLPPPVRDEIRDDRALTEEEKKAKVLLYFLHNSPMASWEGVAGALYWRKEERALQAVIFCQSHKVSLLCRHGIVFPSNSSSSLVTVTFDLQYELCGSCSFVCRFPRRYIIVLPHVSFRLCSLTVPSNAV